MKISFESLIVFSLLFIAVSGRLVLLDKAIQNGVPDPSNYKAVRQKPRQGNVTGVVPQKRTPDRLKAPPRPS
jgi:hypothetical protein